MTRLGQAYSHKAPKPYACLLALSDQLRRSERLEPALLDLVYLRASQLNGCGFCIEMHVAEAELHGVSAERLHALVSFRTSARFSERERAALEWTEQLTSLDASMTDEQYAAMQKHFDDAELVELTLAIGVINVWNRLNVAFETPAEKGREVAIARAEVHG